MFKKTPGLELLSTCSDKCGGDDDEQLTFNELQGIEKERREILLRVSMMQLCFVLLHPVYYLKLYHMIISYAQSIVLYPPITFIDRPSYPSGGLCSSGVVHA